MGKEKPVFGFQFTSYVFGTSLSAGQTCMLNLVVTHSNTVFWIKKETFCKLILHMLSTARQCQFPYSFVILNLINVNTVNFSLSHSNSPMLSNVHKR